MGRRTATTDENGNKRAIVYDPIGKPAKLVDGLLKETLFSYDTEGNLVSKTDPLGNKTAHEYDALKRLTKTTRAAGTTSALSTSYAYDAAGRRTGVTDPKGRTTNFSLDALGRLSKVTDPAGGTASMERDLLGRVMRATNPNGHSTAYAYDDLGRITEETDPLGNATSLAYDETGALESRTDANGQTTTYSRDLLDRPLSANYPDGTGVQATYDAVGNVLSTTDQTGTTSYEYDNRNRRVREALPGARGTLKREYDAAGRRTSRTDPEGKKTSYAHDAANRLTSVDGPEGETTYGYDAKGRPLGVAYPNGAGETYAYDPLGRVASVTVARGAVGEVLSKLDYSYYDESSNPTSITAQDGKKSTFSYDALDRLAEESHPQRLVSSQKTLSYAYDAAGNRKTKTEGNATTAYAYDDAERMTRAGDEAFSYDRNGNMVGRTDEEGATTSYAYDFEGRLVQAGDETYERDARGRAASSTKGGQKTDYLFDGKQVIREVSEGGEDVDYARGLAGRLISRSQGGEASSYYHHDAIGSVVGLSDSSGALTDSYTYDAFGGELERTGQSEQPYGYLGNRRLDAATGLYDSHARAYDPKHGRFLSMDPVRGLANKPQSLNPYACSLNNPLRFPDPSGLFPEDLESQYGETLTGAEEDPYAGVEQYSEGCPEVPQAPEEGPDGEPVDIDQNIQEAEDLGAMEAGPSYTPPFTGLANDAVFANRVRPYGEQDYKQAYPQDLNQYDDIGNFNFGATGAAMGYDEETLRTAGGADQAATDAYNGNPGANGVPYFGENYGDEPDDYDQINAGIDYYENGCGDF